MKHKSDINVRQMGYNAIHQEDINAKQGRGFHGCFCRVEKKKRVFFSLLLLWVRKGIWLIVE